MSISTLSRPKLSSQTFSFFALWTVLSLALLMLVTPATAQGFAPDRDLSAQDAHQAVLEETLVLIDIRTPEEWAQTGIAQGAYPMSMLDQEFLTKLDLLQEENPGKMFAFICASGNRSGVVQAELARRGYENMFSVFGGTTGSRQSLGWIRDGLPIEAWSPS